MRVIESAALAFFALTVILLPLVAGPQVSADSVSGDLALVWSRSDGHNATAWSVRWSPDGSMISQTFFDNTTVIWNSTTGKRIVKLGSHANSEPEGRTRCDGNQTCAITAHLPTRVSAWSPDGKYLAVGGDDTVIYVFETRNWTVSRMLKGHAASVLTLDFSPNGTYLASGSGTDKVVMHNVDNENMTKIWDFARGIVIANLSGHRDGVLEARWSPDGSKIVSASDDKTLKMWNTSTWSLMFNMTGLAGGVLSVGWSPDGKELVSGSRDYKMALWNSTTGKMTVKWSTPNCIRSVDWHKNGRVIAGSGVELSMVMIRNATTGAVLQTLEDNKDAAGNPIGAIMSARWSPDGWRLAIASGKESTIRVYAFGIPKQPAGSSIPGWAPGVLVFLLLVTVAVWVTYVVMNKRVRRTERR